MSSDQCNPSLSHEQCTLETCCIQQATIQYFPSLAGNAAYATIFGLLGTLHLVVGIRYRTWGYMVGALACAVLEVAGYIGRILYRTYPFGRAPFDVQICCLTIAPAFISASVYLTLARLVSIYDRRLSRLKPRWYTLIFCTLDAISLVLQAAGGASAAGAEDPTGLQTGTDILITGLVLQVFSLSVFSLVAADYAWRIKRSSSNLDPSFASTRDTVTFKLFTFAAIPLATLLILVRCCFRVAELSEGFGSSLANNELLFMVLEGPMVFIAMLLLLMLHPGFAIGKENWIKAGWYFREGKKT